MMGKSQRHYLVDDQIAQCPSIVKGLFPLVQVGLVGWMVVSCAARHVEVREQPVGVSAPIQPCRSWGPVVLAP